MIKYGGAAMEDEALREEFARDVVLLKYVGLNPIVVHGGGPEITAYMRRLGLPVEFVGGLRVSDESTVEIAKMVLVGKVNKEIVLRLARAGQPAVGLSGDDGTLFRVARRAGPGGEDIGFVGSIERVNADVIEHVATDYIPVIASVGADREGNSYNVNADEAAGAVAGAIGAYKLLFLTDVPGWLEDPSDPTTLITNAERRACRAGAPGPRRRHAPEARSVPGGDQQRRRRGPHPRRPRGPLAAARAVHRRRRGNEGGSQLMGVAELQAIEAERVLATYARLPVEFVRGEGSALWDAEGNEYLDLLCGISVTSLGHCHPRVVEAVREQVGAPDARQQPLLQRPRDAARAAALGAVPRRSRVPLQLRGRGQRGGHQARPPGAPGGEIVVVLGAFHGRTLGALSATPQEAKQAPFAPLVPGFRAVPAVAEAVHGAVHGGTAAVMLEPIQGEGGVHVLDEQLLLAARAACDEHGAALIFDEIQTGMGRTGTPVGLRTDARRARRPDQRQGPRRRAADRGAGHRRATRRHLRARRPRLDLRRRPGRRAGRPAGAGRDRRRVVCWRGCWRSAATLTAGLQSLPHVLEVRGRGLMLACELDVDAPAVVREALLRERLVLNATGPSTLRLLPALTIAPEQVEDALGRLGAVLGSV